MTHSPAHEHNRRAWNRRAASGARFTQAAPDDYFRDPRAQLDSRGWLAADLAGRRVLCLGAGGGRQSPLFAALGARVTVVDLSGEMLAIDRAVAHERGLDLQAVETSMDDLSMFPPASFDIVWQPVSTCYVPDLLAVYQAVARVTVAGGLYVSQHKQPTSLQADAAPAAEGYLVRWPYHERGPLPPVAGSQHREEGTLEFLHRWEELIGGLCRSGFVIEDLSEPQHAERDALPGTFAHRARYLPPYVRIKARRQGTVAPAGADAPRSGRLWTPDPAT